MHQEFIKKLTEIAEANLANEKFGIEELAKEMGMSRISLYRKFKLVTNQTGGQFIRELRLKKAKDLLLSEDFTVAEISYKVGFASPTYFSKCFHEYYGCSPGELKNQLADKSIAKESIKTFPKTRNRRNIYLSLSVTLVVVVSVFIFLIVNGSNDVKDKSLAVLPFKYLSAETGKEYIADDLMDGILSHFSKIYDLRVVSRTSVEQYRNTDKEIPVIGKELDVAYVVEGSFLARNEDNFRLTLQLINAKDDRHVWSHQYYGNKETIFDIESKAAEDIAGQLNAVITPDEKQMIQRVPTTNLNAYDFYKKAKEYEAKNTKEAFENARLLYQRALKYDSTYALAYVGLANVYFTLHQWDNYFQENYNEYLDSVLFLINQALSYDNKCADAYLMRSRVYGRLGKDDLAMKDLNNAIKYNPNDPKAYEAMIGWPWQKDLIEPIILMHKMVNRFHGNVWYLTRLGGLYLGAGFPELALPYFEQILELEPDSVNYFCCMADYEKAKGNNTAAYQYIKKVKVSDADTLNPENQHWEYCRNAGHYDEAFKYARKWAEVLKKAGMQKCTDMYWIYSNIALCFWKVNKTTEAKYFVEEGIKNDLELIKLGRAEEGDNIFLNLATCYAFLGEKAYAYQYLDKWHVKSSYPVWEVNSIKSDSLFNNLRGEPRFETLRKDVEAMYNAEYKEKHEKVRKWLISQDILEPGAK